MNKTNIERVYKGGKSVDLTPPEPRTEWFYERHKIFLNGLFRYDSSTGKGHVVD